eukprot:scaffold9920_cov32-Tisochrysis_lutea.AAC.6
MDKGTSCLPEDTARSPTAHPNVSSRGSWGPMMIQGSSPRGHSKFVEGFSRGFAFCNGAISSQQGHNTNSDSTSRAVETCTESVPLTKRSAVAYFGRLRRSLTHGKESDYSE